MNKEIDDDPFRWMEEVDTPAVQTWLDQQEKKTSSYLGAIPVRAELRKRFATLFATEDMGLPRPHKVGYFFWKRRADQDLHVLYLQKDLASEARVLIDPNTLSADKSVTVRETRISKDGRFLAYTLSQTGSDKSALHVMNVETGEILEDSFMLYSDPHYPAIQAWHPGNTGFWYCMSPTGTPDSEAMLYRKVFFHRLGDDRSLDKLVFGATLTRDDYPRLSISDNGRYLLIGVARRHDDGSRYYEVHLGHVGERDFTLVIKSQPDTVYSGAMHRDSLYLCTDDGAPHYKLLKGSLEDALHSHAQWKTVIPEGQGVINEFEFIGNKLFVVTLENVHSIIREYTLEGAPVREVALPTLGTASGLSCEPEGNELFFAFSSFAVPDTIYRLNLATDQLLTFYQAVATFDVSEVETKQVWYTSKDGTRIPMFLVSKKGLRRNGDNPTVLYGYGGFNHSLTPDYMKSIIPFVERGGIFAIANLRGGGEFGKEWHQGGIRDKKQNVFDDFTAAMHWLIDENYTNIFRLAIEGGSNGGLLVLATVNQHPGLMTAAVAQVPVADMLRFHLFGSGAYWVSEYGNPDDPEARWYLRHYSPYHKVKDGMSYPAILISTSENDDRVHPMHSFKMTARLQEANGSKKPIILRVERKAGHGGANAVSKYVETATDTWSFVFRELHML